MEIKTFTRTTPKPDEKEAVLRLPNKTDIIPSALMFLLGRASIAGMYPFICAFFGAAFDKRTAYIGILSMLGGLLSAGQGVSGVRFVFAAVVYWLYSYIKDDKKNEIMSAIVCSGGVLICGGMFLPYTDPSLHGVILLFAESVLTGFLYIAFNRGGSLVKNRGTRTQIAQEELICLAICIGGVISGFSGIKLPWGIEIVRIFSMYAIIVISMYASVGTAVVSTVMLAVCTAANMGNSLYAIGMYALCAVFASMLKGFGRLGVVIGFLGGGAIGMLFTWDIFDFPARVSEMIMLSILFLATPKRALHEMGSFLTRTLHSEALRTDLRIKGYLCNRLDKLSASFRKLEESFTAMNERNSKYNEDIAAALFDEVADSVCKSCGMCRQCWQVEFDDMYKQMYNVLEIIDTRGYCDTASVPPALSKRCVRIDTLIEEFAHKYELYKSKAMWQTENERTRNLIVKQYGEISNVISELSLDIRDGFSFMDELEDKLIETLDREGFHVREVSIIENAYGATEVFVKAGIGTNIKALCKCVSDVVQLPMELRSEQNGLCRFTSKCEYSVEIASYQCAKTGEEYCGDSIIHFQTDDNRYCVALCDGMGTGSSAEEESRLATELLQNYLKTGISEYMTVEMINSSLSLKSDNEFFSTIDIFVADLMSGECRFIKMGGAESFIKHDNTIDVIFSKTLPAGILPNIYTETVNVKLHNGDTVIMATDGVTETGDSPVRGEWIKGVLEVDNDVDTLAECIIEGAVKKSGGKCRDDMTVAVIRLKATSH